MRRWRLTGMLDARGIEPDPDGPLMLYDDVALLLSDPVMEALAVYVVRLAAWDADTSPRVHAFESAGLDDGLRAALRAERAEGRHPCPA